MKGSVVIDLMRHGEPEGGVRFRGKLDDPLTAQGMMQMQMCFDVFVGTPWCCVYSSPLQRCAKFAKKAAAQKNIPLLVEPAIEEIGFGKWEGKTSEEIYQEDAVSLTQFWSDPMSFHPKGAEPLGVFQKRVELFLHQLLAKHAHQRVLLVTHSGVIKLIIAHALGLPLNHLYRLKIDFAHLAQLQYFSDSSSFLLRAFNTTKFTHNLEV